MSEEEDRGGKRPRAEFDLRNPLLETPFCTKYGKLENGLTYYIRRHSRPKSKIEVCLVVNVGSIHEQDQESGVAHLVEHLAACRATNKVSNNDAVQSSKVKLPAHDPHSNAFTHYDCTLYHFTAEKFEDLSDAIALIREFCSDMDVSEDDLKKEKGVVLAEYSMHLENVENREKTTLANLLFKDTKYCAHPIGSKEVISTVSLQAVKDFYKRWYKLPNMAAIVVGDFSESQSEEIAKLVEHHFCQKDIGGQSSSLNVSMPMHREPRFHCYVEPKNTRATVYVSFGFEKPKFKTLEDLKKIDMAKMVASALVNRLEHRVLKSKNCVMPAWELMDDVKLAQYLQIKVECIEGDVLETFEIILTELAEMRVYGFSEEELKDLTTDILDTYERYHRYCTSRALRDSYVEHFLCDTPVFGPDYETNLQRTLMSKVSRIDLWDYSKTLKSDHNLSVLVSEPKPSTTTKDLEVIISKINALERDGKIPKCIVEKLYDPIDEAAIVPGIIEEHKNCSLVGLTEWRLSNGMQISFKHTDNGDDVVHIQGFSEGGLSELDSSLYLTGSAAYAVARWSSSDGFQREVPGYKETNRGVYIEKYSRGFFVESPSSHVNTALQLVYSLFNTNSDVEDFEEDRILEKLANIKEELSANEKYPERVLQNIMAEVFYGSEYKPLASDDLSMINPIFALMYFEQCFLDPSNFRVIIVGNLDRTKLIESVLLYLGGIEPVTVRTEGLFPSKRDGIKKIPTQFPPDVNRFKLSMANVGDQSSVNLSFPIKVENAEYDVEIWTLNLMLSIIRIKCFNILRHKEGATYDVTVNYCLEPDFSSMGTTCGYISIEFQCNQDVAWKLVDIMVKEIQRLQQHGLKDLNLSDFIKDLNLQWEDNENWIEWIMSCYKSCHYQGDIDRTHKDRIEMHNGLMAKVSEEFVKSAFERILTNPCNKNYYAMVLDPSSDDPSSDEESQSD